MADVVQILILSKYPRLYLDHDIFFMVPVSEINSSNYACTQSDDIFAIGVIGVDKNGLKIIEFHLR